MGHSRNLGAKGPATAAATAAGITAGSLNR
jgi:hypothetical protein